MKIQVALLQAIGLAVLSASCGSNAAPEKNVSTHYRQPGADTSLSSPQQVDTSGKDSLQINLSEGECPACGMG